jgi:hypothetical protein
MSIVSPDWLKFHAATAQPFCRSRSSFPLDNRYAKLRLVVMAGDFDNLLTPRLVATVTAVILIAIVLGMAITRGLYALLRRQTEWKRLAQKFPATDAHKFGGRYKRQAGFFGRGNRINGMFTIELAHEGLLVTAGFAKNSPILIPWPAIRDVTVTSLMGFLSMVLVTVDYEKQLEFTVPAKALKELQQNVPAERFHQTSVSELIKSRLNRPRP